LFLGLLISLYSTSEYAMRYKTFWGHQVEFCKLLYKKFGIYFLKLWISFYIVSFRRPPLTLKTCLEAYHCFFTDVLNFRVLVSQWGEGTDEFWPIVQQKQVRTFLTKHQMNKPV
jgi:hypothetical protein